MGILATSPKVEDKTPMANGKRRSMQADFASLKPLNPNGLAGFSKFRDPNEHPNSNGVSARETGKRRQDDGDSDDEDVDIKQEVIIKTEGDDMQDTNEVLSPEDAKRQAELAQGVQKIRVSKSPKATNTLMLTEV